MPARPMGAPTLGARAPRMRATRAKQLAGRRRGQAWEQPKEPDGEAQARAAGGGPAREHQVWSKNEQGVWSDGTESAVWVEPETGVIMVKISSGSDPEEMNAEEARDLCALLARLADESDALDLSDRQGAT